MSDAPERIWIDAWGGNWSPVSGGTQGIEYIRADLHAAEIAALQAQIAAELAKVAKLVEYHAASEEMLSVEAEWRSRKADGLLDGPNIFNLTDKLTTAEARLAKASAAIAAAKGE